MQKLCLILVAVFCSLSGAGAAPQMTLETITLRQNFLTELLIRVQTEALLNRETTRKHRNCLQDKSSDLCQMIRSQVFTNFAKVTQEARMHLALGYRDGLFSGNLRTLNSKLKNLGTYKDVSWERLNPTEVRAGEILLERYQNRVEDEASKKFSLSHPKHAQMVDLLLREKRIAHLNSYKDLLSQIVLLQYMKTADVDAGSLRIALDKMLERSDKEISSLSQAAKAAQLWMKNKKACALTVDFYEEHPGYVSDPSQVENPCLQTPSSLLRLLDYGSIVQGLLLENSSFEGVYSELLTERKIRSMTTLIVTGVPVLAACILAPPMVAIPIGALSGGLAVLSSQNDYNRLRRRELSVMVNASGTVDWEALKQGRFARNVSVALMPFFGLGRPLLKSVRFSPQALKIMNTWSKVKAQVR